MYPEDFNSWYSISKGIWSDIFKVTVGDNFAAFINELKYLLNQNTRWHNIKHTIGGSILTKFNKNITSHCRQQVKKLH